MYLFPFSKVIEKSDNLEETKFNQEKQTAIESSEIPLQSQLLCNMFFPFL